MSTQYWVSSYENGRFCGVVAGHGKNKNTWDYLHSRSAAYRLKREMEKRNDGRVYKVENQITV